MAIENSRNFCRDKLTSYTRKEAFEFMLAKEKNLKDYDVVKTVSSKQLFDPFESVYIPSMSNLQQWECELENISKLTLDRFAIECELGLLDLSTVKKCKTLLSSKQVKESVRQELDFFNQGPLKPSDIKTYPNVASINYKQYKFFIKHYFCFSFRKRYDLYNLTTQRILSLMIKKRNRRWNRR